MADVEALLAGLTRDEKVALTAGEDFWSTVAVPRLGIPKIRLTDGPNGARGAAFGPSAPPSVCVPCGSALGATWNPALVEAVGALLGREALERGCRVLLAPTMNLHRSPLAGRNFECSSEDPWLSGRLAAGFVRGVQSEGVIATAKHFVGNDAEFERGSMDSRIDPRALRELYLVPFEHAIRDGGALAVMTSYNRVNGRWVTEQPELLRDLLRTEWGFEGLVMTDWFGIADTAASAAAGLDLEMPGPGRAFGPALAAALDAGTVAGVDVDAMVRRTLTAFDRIGALDSPTEPAETTEDRAEDRALARRAATEAMVLLRNEGVLPLVRADLRTVAVIGPNAHTPAIMGGGSAQVTPHYVHTPLDALRVALEPQATVHHERGCSIARTSRALGSPGLRADGAFTLEVLDADGAVVRRSPTSTAQFLLFGAPEGVAGDGWRARLTGRVVAEESGPFQLSVAQCGRTRVFIDGTLVLDGVATPPPPGGTDFFGMGSTELLADVALTAGQVVDVRVEYAPTGAAVLFATKVGFRYPDPADLIERAVEAARDADAVIVVVGTNDEWERETHDRESMHLPGAQDELVARVAVANPRTVVVVNAGAPVDLGWAGSVGAVLQCWFGGQEMAGALCDVLLGAGEPGGRLATTVPERVEHNPSFDNFPGENGQLRYGEGVFMGYRGYDHRCLPVRFPFGHGLGYTTFALGAPRLSATTWRAASGAAGDPLTVTVPVTNTGDRPGSEVVQLYVAPVSTRLARPPKELRAFAKVELQPGASTDVVLELDDRAFAYWDPGQPDWDAVRPRLGNLMGVEGRQPIDRRAPGWQVDAGRYALLIGRSSAAIAWSIDVELV
jgi:beta-glucosidase